MTDAIKPDVDYLVEAKAMIIMELTDNERDGIAFFLDLEKYGYSSLRNPKPIVCVSLKEKGFLRVTVDFWELTDAGRKIGLSMREGE